MVFLKPPRRFRFSSQTRRWEGQYRSSEDPAALTGKSLHAEDSPSVSERQPEAIRLSTRISRSCRSAANTWFFALQNFELLLIVLRFGKVICDVKSPAIVPGVAIITPDRTAYHKVQVLDQVFDALAHFGCHPSRFRRIRSRYPSAAFTSSSVKP